MDAESSNVMSDQAEAFAARVFTQVVDAFEVLSLYIGDRLDLYRALRDVGPLSAAQLAERSGMHPRYAREWLEQQTVAGYLVADPEPVEGEPRRFRLPEAHAVVLTDPHSLLYTSPLARLAVAAASRMPSLLQAYRSGAGVGWAEFGADARDAQADINRPWFDHALAGTLAALPEVWGTVTRPGARIADVGCGLGWSTRALARALPGARVDGFDVDTASIDSARASAEEDLRVTFTCAAGETLADDAEHVYDAAFIFEALHDMPRPVEVLRAVRRAVKADGVVIVMDEAVADEFGADMGEIERIMYAYSILICLPDGMSTQPTAATGTVMRPPILRDYATRAGYRDVRVLPVEDFAAFRFYHLVV